jgi:hypothetical protein
LSNIHYKETEGEEEKQKGRKTDVKCLEDENKKDLYIGRRTTSALRTGGIHSNHQDGITSSINKGNKINNCNFY